MSLCRPAPCLLFLLLALVTPARGIILYSSGDPTYNTNAPGGALANSGWQYTGPWGEFIGTVIAPRYFITAKHINTIGTQRGDPFRFRGQTYTTLTNYDDPGSDLRIWRVCGSFPPPYAPLYTNGAEANQGVIMIGRGTQRGTEVRAGLVNALKGWTWGTNDTVQRWGSNTVAGFVSGGPTLGILIRTRFNAGAGPDEGQLSYGDSGGPMFVKDGTTWKLAAINYAADGYYTLNTNDPSAAFYAALFDESDVYKDVNQVWTPGTLSAGSSYATRIADSNRINWINSILNQAPPPDPPPVLQSAANVVSTFADDPAAVVNTAQRTITVPVSGPRRFYRLRACSVFRISHIAVNGANVVLDYQ